MRVVDREELELEIPHPVLFALLHLYQPVTADAVLLQFASHQGEGQLGTVNGNVGPLLE